MREEGKEIIGKEMRGVHFSFVFSRWWYDQWTRVNLVGLVYHTIFFPFSVLFFFLDYTRAKQHFKVGKRTISRASIRETSGGH